MGRDNTSTDVDSQPRWLTEREAASRLRMSVNWLQAQRLHGRAPRYAKFGSAVRYSIVDIEAFERLSLRYSTSDGGNR